MKKLYLIFILPFVLIFFNINTSNAQLSQDGIPVSFINYDLSEHFGEILIPTPDMNKLMEEDLENDEFSYPRRFAKLIPVKINPDNSGTWEKLADGSRVWRLKLRSEGALAISLYFNDFYLPKDAELFLYDDDRNQVKGAYIFQNNQKSRLFATELMLGDAIILELNLPDNLSEKPSLQISDFGYAYRDVPQYGFSKGFGSSDFCEINPACPEGANWQDEKKGVVRIQVRVSGSGFWCTGSLVNNVKQDLTPYILTADHCAFQFNQYADEDDLNQWIFYFVYESETCEDPLVEPEIKSLIGASRIAQGGDRGSTGSDFYFVLLNNNTIPAAYDPYFNGWDITGSVSSSGVTIHHPEGDIKKISTYTTPIETFDFLNGGNYAHWKVFWTETITNWGVTEPGSSGSPLFDSEGRIIGTLTGGYAACESFGNLGPDKPDYYGKFSYHWQSNGNADTIQLKPWLDPDNSGVTVLDGTTVGISANKINEEKFVNIYPNPAENFVYLNFINFEPEEIQVLLFDIIGKPIKEFNFYSSSEDKMIDMSDIPSGIYFIRIDNHQGLITKRVIKK
ncbi:MAG: T9SS type A sorting domain-containing protein [Bacteroidales bacterium]|nr:T9SS type A sorting domain-containing protein [Bacteroidales bacterium]